MSYGASHKVREIGKEVGTGEYGAAPRIPHTAVCRSPQRTAAQPATTHFPTASPIFRFTILMVFFAMYGAIPFILSSYFIM